jgi:N-acetylglucosaminyldiphosphoundecaprenol N-acetyl-beta-D-mannosaminyltransferase
MGASRAERLLPAGAADETFPDPPTRRILGMRVDATSYDDAAGRILRWGKARQSRYVCVATVNNVMEAYDDAAYREVMNDADLVTSDGMPLVWGLRALGVRSASRVYGPDLTPVVCERAARDGVPVGFYGGRPDVVETMTAVLRERYPALRIAYSWSPPFRALDAAEDDAAVGAINDSGAAIVFVGLGSPKQDRWMAAHRGRVKAVMIGVGAAFDFIAGVKRQAPRAVQAMGLEWLFRLVTEPRRLWRRYIRQNPRFVWLFVRELARSRFTRKEAVE